MDIARQAKMFPSTKKLADRWLSRPCVSGQSSISPNADPSTSAGGYTSSRRSESNDDEYS